MAPSTARGRADAMAVDAGNAALAPRYERKFRVDETSRAVVLRAIAEHPALFREIFHERYVNSIYFDTPDLRLYFANVDGDAERDKVRLRWYGEMLGSIRAPTLERKRKFGLVGSKDSVRVGDFALHAGIHGAALVRALDHDAVPPPLRSTCRALRPLLLVRYRRRYFLSSCGRFRVTVDDDLQFVRLEEGVNALARRARDPAVIIELKYAAEDDRAAAAVAKAMPFRLTRNSKYVVGVDSLFHV